ncbi:MAG: protein translocase subunit SecF, partial [Gammaproteobacteria bacterium]
MPFNFDEPKFDFMTKKPLWFGVSAALLVPGLIAIVLCFMQFGTPVKLGIDFTGGTLAQLTFAEPVKAGEIRDVLAANGFPEAQVQIADERTALIRTKDMSSEDREKLLKAMTTAKGEFTADRFETVGPTMGKELLTNSML